ncbi:cell wall-binding repeat-containing protein [Phycicoccus sp. BSK3Z-2]|uniref:Cell wall-binding repeat-containing protein n=1 Tax=Phycicoccus avicenniae TaxID=2828860 RepID=A0A941HYY4_9MICO|nr:cell wall-binding repeat-containing protein [Phycicoccus avicenniae]
MGAADPRPSVVVSHVDIVYRVYAGGRSGGSGERRGVRTVHAVKDVSFVAHHGESIGVIGRNGSGKSTLLRTVAGLVPPTSGEVWADGTPSLLGVNAVLVKQLSGARNIYIGAQALGLSKAEVDEIYDEIVEFSEIGDAIHLPMSTYSSGMAARLRFAISTAATPPVLVIDEALATGDAHFRARSQERIEKLRGQAGTVFLVSHSAATIRAMCDRALWLDQGELVMDGPVDEVVDAYAAAAERSLGAGGPVEPEVPGVERWKGRTRFHTSALVSRQGTPDRCDTVVLASGADLALALSAVPAATTVGAPVLLTSSKRLMKVTAAEVERLGARRVVLLGDAGVVDEDVADALRESGVAVERVEEGDAESVSVALLDDLDASSGVDTVYLVPGEDPMAALSAVLTARPGRDRVLLVGPEGVRDAHVEALRRIAPARVVVVADAEDVAEADLAPLRELATEGVERWLSPTPVQAAAEAADGLAAEAVGVVFVASSQPESVGDAVTGAAVAALANAPILLVDRDEVPSATHAQLERLAPSHVVLLGGEMAVAPAVRQSLAGYLRQGGPGRGESEGDVDL